MKITREQIEASFKASLVYQAQRIKRNNGVLNLSVDEHDGFFTISAEVQDGRNAYETTIELDGNRFQISGYCGCAMGSFCRHMVATLLVFSEDGPAEVGKSSAQMETEKIERQLGLLTVQQLRTIAKRHRWELSGSKRQDVVEQMVANFQKAAQEGRFFNELSPSQAEFLSMLHLVADVNIGVTDTEVVTAYAKLGKRGQPKKLIAELCEYGALVKEPFAGQTGYSSIIATNLSAIGVDVLGLKAQPARRFIRTTERLSPPPILVEIDQVGRKLSPSKQIQVAPPAWQPVSASNYPRWFSSWPTDSRDLDDPQLGIVAYITGEKSVPLQIRPRLFSGQTMSEVADVLDDVEKAEWLLDLLVQLRLFRPDQDSFVFDVSAYDGWQESSPERQLLELFQAWRSLPSEPFELRKLINHESVWSVWRLAMPGLEYGHFLMEFAIAHRTLCAFLSQIALAPYSEQRDWFKVDELLKQMKDKTPALYHQATSTDTWGFSYKGEPIAYVNNRRWQNTYGQLIRYLISGPLYWFGMVDLLEKDDRAIALRLTPLGRWLLNPAKSYEEMLAQGSAEETTFSWQDDRTLQLVAGRDIGHYLTVINRYMKPLLKPAAHYRLDTARLEKAMIAGETQEDIQTAFASVGITLQPSAQSYLQTLNTQSGKVHLYEGLTLMEFSDEFALTELRAAKILSAENIVYEFSPRLIVINEDDVNDIMRQMRKRNYTPRLIERKTGGN